MAKSKPKSKKKYKRGDLIRAIYGYFTQAGGLDKVTYEKTMAIAKKIKPDTKFNRYHYAWYRNDYPNFLDKQHSKEKQPKGVNVPLAPRKKTKPL